MLNFDLDVLTVDLDMLATDQGLDCGGFKPWRLVLVMVTTNKKQYERLRRFFSLKDFLLFWSTSERIFVVMMNVYIWLKNNGLKGFNKNGLKGGLLFC